MSGPALFQPLKVGQMELKHRIVMTPMSRYRANEDFVPQDKAVEYYSQRASTPGTLLITEGTFISARAGLYEQAPGIWNKEQIAGWKKVTDAVHRNGSYVFVQLWSLGRAADLKLLTERGAGDLIGAGDIPMDGAPKPRPMTKDEIKEMIQEYAQAAKNAIEAGFDGVELHNANGYLPDQFLQDVSNNRTDEYGGSIENRARFSLETVDALVAAVGEEKVGVRLSPWNVWQNMKMANPIPQFSYLVEQFAARHPKLAYIHAVESRIAGVSDHATDESIESLDFIRKAWGEDKVLIRAGGYKTDSAIKIANENPNTLIGVGRYFISNPDLPRRWQQNVAVVPYNRDTFYTKGETKGYTDYTCATEVIAVTA